jgi:hypothetical protein
MLAGRRPSEVPKTHSWITRVTLAEAPIGSLRMAGVALADLCKEVIRPVSRTVAAPQTNLQNGLFETVKETAERSGELLQPKR